MNKYSTNKAFIETEESLEDMTVAPGMFAATIFDGGMKGHTVQVEVAYFNQAVDRFSKKLDPKTQKKRLKLYSGAINYLVNVSEKQLPGIDNAFQLLTNVLISIICNPNEQLRNTLLKGIEDVIHEKGRAHLTGSYLGDAGFVWMVSEGKEMELSA